jgi:hypothetical protein
LCAPDQGNTVHPEPLARSDSVHMYPRVAIGGRSCPTDGGREWAVGSKLAAGARRSFAVGRSARGTNALPWPGVGANSICECGPRRGCC